MSFKLKLPPFENVAANQTAIVPRLPIGNMYNALIFELGGTVFTQAQVLAIRVIANGKTIWNVTGAHLDLINGYDRLTDTATFLAIWFSDPTVQNQVESQLGALDTSRQIAELALEVDIGAATAPTLVGRSIVSAPSRKDDKFAGFFKSLLKSVHAPAAAGEFDLPVALGSRAGGMIRRVHFMHANITHLSVKRDGVNLQDVITVAENNYMNEQRWRTAQAGHTAWDPISMAQLDDQVPTLRSGNGGPAPFEFPTTVSAADTITTYTEIVAPLVNV